MAHGESAQHTKGHLVKPIDFIGAVISYGDNAVTLGYPDRTHLFDCAGHGHSCFCTLVACTIAVIGTGAKRGGEFTAEG